MSAIQNIVEYYEELFPVTESQKRFYEELVNDYILPVKFLRVECGTGMFESLLAKSGHDVTGIDQVCELIRSANMRRRTQLMSIRFFEMSYLDMTKFLGKSFYNVISCLDDRILYIHDKILMRKFFYDCKALLSEGGSLILSLPNFMKFSSAQLINLPVRESVRTKLYSEIWKKDNGKNVMVQNIETGNGKMLPVRKDVEVYTLLPEEIESFSKEAGFSSVQFYSDFDKNAFTGKEDTIIAKIN